MKVETRNLGLRYGSSLGAQQKKAHNTILLLARDSCKVSSGEPWCQSGKERAGEGDIDCPT